MNEIEHQLSQSGFQEADIKLAQKVTRRNLETHINMNNIRKCEKCALSLDCHGQKTSVPIVTTERVIGTGPWNSPLMIVGEIPGEHEGKYHVPFVGAEGQVLSVVLAKAGIDRNAIYMTYAVKCAATRAPEQQEVDMCHQNFITEIEVLHPKVILTIGEMAARFVRQDNALNLENERGRVHNVTIAEKTIQVIHAISIWNVLDQKENAKRMIWDDFSLAAKEVKSLYPHYVYDRVGLNEI